MCRAAIPAIVIAIIALILSSCNGKQPNNPSSAAKKGLPATAAPAVKGERADAEALLEKLRQVVPEGWEVTLYWDEPDTFLSDHDWLADEWKDWLPGTTGRRIEVRRKKPVEFWERVSGPDPRAEYARKDAELPRFALMLGEKRNLEEIRQRLAKLNAEIQLLEAELKPSFYCRNTDGYVQHTVSADDRGRRAMPEYDRLWAIKRWFPQWTEGGLAIGFRSMVWLRRLPDEAQAEYRKVKRAVFGVLEPFPDWVLIPAEEDSSEVPTAP